MSGMRLKCAKFLMFFMSLCLLFTTAVIFPSVALADGEEDIEEVEEEYDDEEDDEDTELDLVMNFQASKIEKNKVELKWDKAADIDGYEISYKRASSSSWTTKYIESDSTLKTVIKKLKVNTKYNFRIRTYIYYGEDDEEEEDYEDEEVYDEETYDDEDYEDEDSEEDEEFDDYVYGEYSKMTLTTLTKKGEGSTIGLSTTSELKAVSVKAPTLKTVKSSAAKKADLKWKKVAKASGYEIYMSKKKTSGFKKIKTIKNNATVTFTKSKLVPGKTYYFKVRAYVKSGSKSAYTKYSKVKKVTIKKDK